MPELPPLKETIAIHGLAAKKGLGQHFLLDLNLTRKIAGLTEACHIDTVVEVGPGPGGLTRALLETGAKIIAIERDARVIPVMNELGEVFPDQLQTIESDALTYDETQIAPMGAIIASNLPYNISTELLVKWLTASPRWWSRMVLMFQREVGDRILAAPGSKTYGRLSVIAQAASCPRLGFHLPARAFTPPPKVDSSVLVFETSDVDIELIRSLERVTAAAFGQRRKMLRSTLKPVFGERLSNVLQELDIAETARAETLSIEQFIKLAERA